MIKEKKWWNIPIRTANIKNNYQMFTRIRKTLPSHNLLTEIQNGTATLENNLDISFLKTFTVEKENSRKTSTSALLITPRPLTV